MAYEKTNWEPREGSDLDRFEKANETSKSVILRNRPNAVTKPGTPFSVKNMNKIEQGIYEAHEMIHAEMAERLAADNDLQVAVDNETTARTNAIQTHNEKVTAHPYLTAIINTLIGLPAWNPDNHTLIFTAKDGSTLEVDLPLEDLARDIGFDPVTKEIILLKHDGSEIRISVSDLVDVYTGSIGTHIQITIGSNNQINAILRGGSITDTELSAALLAKINGKLDATAQAADSAKLGGQLPGIYAKQADMQAADQNLQNQINAMTPGQMVPINHASAQTTYGIASSGIYGHARFPPNNAAPAVGSFGYALPYSYLSSQSFNLNNYQTPGIYTLYNPTEVTNFPAGWSTGTGNSACLIVLPFYEVSAVKQILYKRGTNKEWSRYSTTTTAWTAWIEGPIATLEDQNASKSLPSTDANQTIQSLLQTVRNCLYWLTSNSKILFGTTQSQTDFVVETKTNNNEWYRIYKNGWVEQGGYISHSNASMFMGDVTLPKIMLNGNYTITISIHATTASNGTTPMVDTGITLYDVTNIGFKYGGMGTTTTSTMYNIRVYWRVEGIMQ